jgi:hypothetical protein
MNTWKPMLAVFVMATAGCATQTGDGMRAQTAASCSDPIPDGAIIPTCETGVSAATRRTVASDRCIGGVLPRDTGLGSLNRSTLC